MDALYLIGNNIRAAEKNTYLHTGAPNMRLQFYSILWYISMEKGLDIAFGSDGLLRVNKFFWIP